MKDPVFIQNALISVTDKDGVVHLCQKLHQFKIQLYSTGGTAQLLNQHDLPVVRIEDYTQFPEILGGRVKTLHPKIYGGLLQRGACDQDTLTQHTIEIFQLVVVNLYPFEQVIQNQGNLNEAIENIDIGGVSLIRAAAKNFYHTVVLTDIKDYNEFLVEFEQNQGQISYSSRARWASKAFERIAAYDVAIASYFAKMACDDESLYPQTYLDSRQQIETLRYGENPHQRAALYQKPDDLSFSLLQGKPLSYNNLMDAGAAISTIQHFHEAPACVIIKHANPCGIAMAGNLTQAYHKAFQADSVSAFGGIIAFNQEITQELAKTILAQQFVEVIIAPGFSEAALYALQAKPNVRALVVPDLMCAQNTPEIRQLPFGLLVQSKDCSDEPPTSWQLVTEKAPDAEQLKNLYFAWRAVRMVKSNAIVLAQDNMTLGMGGGQTSRVDAMKLAVLKAQDRGLSISGCVLASDAFFPFADSIELAASFGVSAIVQPGGSIRDAEVISACNQANIAMLFTGVRHFLH